MQCFIIFNITNPSICTTRRGEATSSVAATWRNDLAIVVGVFVFAILNLSLSLSLSAVGKALVRDRYKYDNQRSYVFFFIMVIGLNVFVHSWAGNCTKCTRFRSGLNPYKLKKTNWALSSEDRCAQMHKTRHKK